MHATLFLNQPLEKNIPPIVVLSGGEAFLKQASLRRLFQQWGLRSSPESAASSETIPEELDFKDLGVTRFPGKEAELKAVRDELLTVSMFSDRRIVLVEDADEFVTKYRPGLEEYLNKPAKKSVLILELQTWRKGTNLTKKADLIGLVIECTPLTAVQLTNWLVEQAKTKHQKQLSRDAASLMAELAGQSTGLLDQELSKLAAYVGERARITPEDVRQLVGGWKTETTWAMLNAVRDGQLSVALECLGQLLRAGEAALKLTGGVNFQFRKIASTVERSRVSGNLKLALQEAGVFPNDQTPVENYLRRIKRPRAEKLLPRLLEADQGLKGRSPLSEQMQLELLLLDLCGPSVAASR